MEEHGLVYFYFYYIFVMSVRHFLSQVLVSELISSYFKLMFDNVFMPRHTLISIQPYQKHTRLPRKATQMPFN